MTSVKIRESSIKINVHRREDRVKMQMLPLFFEMPALRVQITQVGDQPIDLTRQPYVLISELVEGRSNVRAG